ncbi:MAG: GntR family transcriptional regulator, partial [Deltaproteobacteria bacterium]|nr:GntR family transcriptional regulator [Deltaproteobacteria bacterium]
MKFTENPKIQQLPKLSDQVTDFLISEIKKGAFRPGELLPSEAELTKLFNV